MSRFKCYRFNQKHKQSISVKTVFNLLRWIKLYTFANEIKQLYFSIIFDLSILLLLILSQFCKINLYFLVKFVMKFNRRTAWYFCVPPEYYWIERFDRRFEKILQFRFYSKWNEKKKHKFRWYHILGRIDSDMMCALVLYTVAAIRVR